MAGKGMKVKLVTPEAAALTRSMNRLPKTARPVFVAVGDKVAQSAARDLTIAAQGFSHQSRALSSAITAKRDRVPFVRSSGMQVFRASSPDRRRKAVRVRDIVMGTEYGSKGKPQFTRRAGTVPQRFRPEGYWWNPAVRAGVDRYTRLWLGALDEVLSRAAGR
jgi:hypothetical protein